MPSSRESVVVLKGQGYTNTEIARTIRRDPRVVSQILRGEKPYRNLEGTLSELASRGSAPIEGPPRRESATGETARTRSGYEETQTGFRREVGQYGARDIRRTLERAARQRKRVTLTIHVSYVRGYKGRTMTPGRVPLFEKGGYDAGRVLRALDTIGGDIREAMLALTMRRGDIEEIGEFQGVEINAFD